MSQGHFDAEHLKQYNDARPINAQRKLCHAPHQNLYFGRDGKVSACCYNRTQILGRYPDQLPLEMWKGDNAMRLREEMTDTHMPGGCSYCANQLEAGNIAGLHAKLYDKYADAPLESLVNKFKQIQTGKRENRNLKQNFKLERDVLIRKTIEWIRGTGKGIPIGRIAKQEFKKYITSWWKSPATRAEKTVNYPRCLEFELSNTCNLECAMCFGEFSSSIRKNRENLPPLEEHYDTAFVASMELFLENAWETKFYGGEPFLIPIYYELWETMIRRNPHALVNITTNGTVYNNKVQRILEKLNVVLIVSIDSFEKETYEQIRVNANYERVMENFEAFVRIMRAKGRSLTLATCPMTLNWREIPSILARCNKEDFPLYFNTLWFPLELSLRHLSSTELQEIISYYKSIELTDTTFAQRENNAMFVSLINQLEHWRDLAHSLEMKLAKRKTLQAQLEQNDLYRVLGRIQTQVDAGISPVDVNDLQKFIQSTGKAEQFIRQYFGVIYQSIALHMTTADYQLKELNLKRSIETLQEHLLANEDHEELVKKISVNDHRYTTTLLAQVTFEQLESTDQLWKRGDTGVE
ncbi:MAG: radical SAM protein [Saprospiraceae bacterium]|nr:radical SAM protein [Saprospiraceae bacterium]